MKRVTILSLLLLLLTQLTAIAYDRNSDLFEAARNGNTEAIKKLLSDGADVDE